MRAVGGLESDKTEAKKTSLPKDTATKVSIHQKPLFLANNPVAQVNIP
jgi:hypothetical protein